MILCCNYNFWQQSEWPDSIIILSSLVFFQQISTEREYVTSHYPHCDETHDEAHKRKSSHLSA